MSRRTFVCRDEVKECLKGVMHLRANCSKKSFECMEFELWSTFRFENENSSLRLTRVTSYALKFYVKINRRNIQTVHEHDVLDDVARQINEERLIFPFFFFSFSIVQQSTARYNRGSNWI